MSRATHWQGTGQAHGRLARAARTGLLTAVTRRLAGGHEGGEGEPELERGGGGKGGEGEWWRVWKLDIVSVKSRVQPRINALNRVESLALSIP